MVRLRLIHWKSEEARPRIAGLKAAGYAVDYGPLNGMADLRRIKERPPDAFLIDLSRLPSHGRDMGLFFRSSKTTRHVPLVFVEGEPDKVGRIKALLPDAAFTTWGRVRSTLKKALANPAAAPVVPRSIMDSYRAVPLAKKLGIRGNMTVCLVNAPKGFKKSLGVLPEAARLSEVAGDACGLILWFVSRKKDLEGRINEMKTLANRTALWIIWPKKTSGLSSDLNQNVVRAIGLDAGLVDYKICAVNDTWSGLLFRRRRGAPPSA